MSEVIDYKYMKISKNKYRKDFFTRTIRETISEILSYDNIIGGTVVYSQINGTVEDTLNQLNSNPGFERLVDLYIRITNALNSAKHEALMKTIKNDILSGRCQIIENVKIPDGEINNMNEIKINTWKWANHKIWLIKSYTEESV